MAIKPKHLSNMRVENIEDKDIAEVEVGGKSADSHNKATKLVKKNRNAIMTVYYEDGTVGQAYT